MRVYVEKRSSTSTQKDKNGEVHSSMHFWGGTPVFW